MNNESQTETLRELQALVDQLLDGQLTEEQGQRLEQLVCASKACSDYYFQAMQLTAGLSRGALPPLKLTEVPPGSTADLQVEVATLSAQVEALTEFALNQRAGDVSAINAPACSDEESADHRALFPTASDAIWGSNWLGFSTRHFVLFGIAMLLVGTACGWVLTRQLSTGERPITVAQDRSSVGSASSAPAAYLTMMNGCDWGGPANAVRAVGQSVEMGDEITLYEGIAEFRLASGVSLSIEGPTSLVMTSANSLLLQHGKLTAYVPWAVSDFKLSTSACRLTASDAEFGIFAAGGEVDIHTFSGEVQAASEFVDDQTSDIAIEREEKPSAGSEFLAATIPTGRGLALMNQGGVTKVSRWHGADKDNFATKLTMAGPLPINREYVKSVMQSKPISYWRFESTQDGFIANEIEEQTSLKIFGDLRLMGDSANRVAELGRPGANGYLLSEDGLTFPSAADYSVELWLKPSHLQSGTPVVFLADFAKDRIERAAFLLALLGAKHEAGISQRYPGKIRFLHRNPPGPSASTGTSCFSSGNYALRRWQHVVATKEKGLMRMFVDGTLVATGTDKSPQTSNVHVLVGQLSTTRQLAPLIGQMDELAIYDRALSQAEISKRLKLLKWKPELQTAVRDDDA